MGADWLPAKWLVTLSLAVAVSFAVSSLLNAFNERLYRHIEARLPAIDTDTLSPSDRPIEVGNAEAVVLGMGRIGRSAYRRFRRNMVSRYWVSTAIPEALPS